MTGRRALLKSILGLLLAAPASAFAPDAAAGIVGPGGLAARRHGGYFLVDGWVLTARDVKALDLKVLGHDDL